MRNRFFRTAGVLLLACPALAAAQTLTGVIRNHFDSDAAMRPPAFFDFVEVGVPGFADWVVMADFNPPSAPNVLVQTAKDRPADSIAAALRRNVSFRDGRASVALKIGTGRGGVLCRMADDKNFLVLLVDTTTGEARLLSYRDGKPEELAHAKAPLSTEWQTVALTATGAELKASWAGKPLLTAADPHPVAGRVGLATAGAGTVSFDELVLESTDSK